MKNIILKRLLLILTMSCFIFVVACGQKKVSTQGDESSKQVITNNLNSNETQSEQATISSATDTLESTEENDEIDESIPIDPNKEISIYTMNESTFEVEPATALISEDSEVTPELIVDLVVDSFADKSVKIGIDSIKTKDDAVIVSFLSNQPPLVNVGGSVETTILDAIAQSLVDNLDDYTKVIFRVEGQAYASGHYEFKINQVYLDGE